MFGLKLNRILSSIELQKEKQKDYRNVVIAQVIIIVSGLIFSVVLHDKESQLISKIVITLFFIFGTAYSFLLWDLLRDFTNNQILIRTVLAILVVVILTGILFEFPLYSFIKVQNRAIILFIIHAMLLPVEIIVIAFSIRDIFTGNYLTTDKIWGAACVYLMIGISFGSLYDLINIVNPISLGEKIELGFQSYSECIYYSFNILGGLDTAYPNATNIIRNIGVIEAVWGNLFAILIIGKLLTLPKKKIDIDELDA